MTENIIASVIQWSNIFREFAACPAASIEQRQNTVVYLGTKGGN